MYDLGFGIALDITSVVCVLLVSIPGVMNQAPCGSGSSPVVRMCYSNNITFSSDGFATTEGLVGGARKCTCILTTDVSTIRLKVGLESAQNGCFGSKITLRANGATFGTTITCEKPKTTRIVSFSNANGYNQVYNRAKDDKMCFKYSVISGLTGGGNIIISCSGDDLPITTTTTSVQTTKTTATGSPITSSSDKSSTETAPSTSKTSPSDRTSEMSSSSLKTTLSNLTKSTGSATGGASTQTVAIETPEMTTINETTSHETSTEGSTSGTATITDYTSTRSPTSGTKPDTSNKIKNGIIAAVVVSSIVFIVLVVLLIVFLERKRRAKKNSSINREGVSSQQNPAYVSSGGPYTISADVTEMSPSTNVDENKSDEVKLKENVKVNGKSDEDISSLYATIDRSKNADTLF